MKIFDKIQYILLYLLGFCIIGGTSLITGGVGFNKFKDATWYVDNLLTYVAIILIIIATIMSYVDNFKDKNKEYLSAKDYIEQFAMSKAYIPTILSRFLEFYNRIRKIAQHKYNVKRKLHYLENAKKFLWFGKKYTDRDFYIWNHGTESEKETNAYCKKRKFLEEKLKDEYIQKNIDVSIIKYDVVTSGVVLGGFYSRSENDSPNDFITKNKGWKIAKDKIPKLLFSFGMSCFTSSLIISFKFNASAILNISVKLMVLVWNTFTTIKYARDFAENVTLHDIRFRKGVLIEYNKWVLQEAASVAEKDKQEIKKKEDAENDKRTIISNTSTSLTVLSDSLQSIK